MSKPPGRYSSRDIAHAGNISTRTLTAWHQDGVMPRPPLSGSRVAYGPDDLVRVRIVARMRGQSCSLETIRLHLAGKTSAELEAMLNPAKKAEPTTSGGPAAPSYPASRWERIELVPGLEIHVDAGRGQALRQLAQHIYSHYGPAPSAGTGERQ